MVAQNLTPYKHDTGRDIGDGWVTIPKEINALSGVIELILPASSVVQ